jgi:hypothetical protein
LWDNPAWVKQYARKVAHGFSVLSGIAGKRYLVENVVGGRPLGYYILNDANEAIYEVRGFPSTYVIDKRGRVVASHVGLAQWNSPPIRDWVLGLAHSGGSAARAPQRSNTAEARVPAWGHHLLSHEIAGPQR